jgi:hypothetical protein
MNIELMKKEIYQELVTTTDEKLLWAIARLLHLDDDSSPEWHRNIVEERFEMYHANPTDVITWGELQKQMKK